MKRFKKLEQRQPKSAVVKANMFPMVKALSAVRSTIVSQTPILAETLAPKMSPVRRRKTLRTKILDLNLKHSSPAFPTRKAKIQPRNAAPKPSSMRPWPWKP